MQDGMATMKKPSKPNTITIGTLQLNRNYVALGAITLVLLYFMFFSGSGGGGGGTTSYPSTAGLKVKHAALPDYVRRNDDLKYILTKTREMQVDVADFWLTHGPDIKYGGFYGTLDRQGKPTSPSYKGLIQQVCGFVDCVLLGVYGDTCVFLVHAFGAA